MRVSGLLIPALLVMAVVACGGNDGADDQPNPACSDGVDNDGDAMTDYPEDLGCTDAADETEDTAAMPVCNDGRDNDGDGLIDFPHDPGCFAPQAADEIDDCPDGPLCPQCSNGQDDDTNGSIDYPDDPGCEHAADASEFLDNPAACGAGMKIKQLPALGEDMGVLEATSISTIASPCGGGGGAPAIAYVLHLTVPRVIFASTDQPGTNVDTVIDIRSANCMDPSAHLACSDDISTSNNKSEVTHSLLPGTYYIIVQGQNSGVSGAYTLKVQQFAGEGVACNTQPECGPGLVCRTPVGGSEMLCSKPVCSDGADDDADGKSDHPNDPGCATPEDGDEGDDCPSGTNCPACGDGTDNDTDGMTDFPADNTCKAAGDTSESCPTTEGVISIVTAATMGDTTMATSDVTSCETSTSGSGPDRTYRLDLPAMTSLDLNMTASFDTVTTLFDSSCGGTAIECSDPLAMNVTNLAAGTYYFVVDGYFPFSDGPYTIHVSGHIVNGQSCESDLAQAGAITCGPGYTCKGSVGSRTCQIAQCNDGMDNNNNGKTDYPLDPGCDSASDNTETTVCPGASCPVCSNGVDDDLDGDTDYPDDPSCIAASGNNESCLSAEPIGPLTQPVTMGTTTGASDDAKLACASTSTNAPDLTYRLDIPPLDKLTLDLDASFTSVAALFDSTCGGNTALSCLTPDAMVLTDLQAGTYYYVVDGNSNTNGSGSFTLTVSGTIENGFSCESPLAQSGALTCGTNHVCKGPASAKTCQLAACSDGIDNNGNGKIDYPHDPGCAGADDDSETDLCPGAACPVCANGGDDDTDGTTDFPSDYGCSAASGLSEAFCAIEPDFGGIVTMPTTMGTLATAADNYDQTCVSNTGNDAVYSLQLPVAVDTLTIDTTASTIGDTVLSFKDASCGVELDCDDDSSPDGLLSQITATDVPAGNYAIQVDAYGTSNNGAYTLNVRGVVAPQTACTSPLFASGVLECPNTTECTAGICQ